MVLVALQKMPKSKQKKTWTNADADALVGALEDVIGRISSRGS
jgi:hypothetical protein